MDKMGNRIGWLEVTRFIAILLVLIIHTVDEAVYKSGPTINSSGIFHKHFIY